MECGKVTGAEMTVTVRDATADDVAAIRAIYARHVRDGLASFEEVPPTVAEMAKRFAAVTGAGFPYVAAEKDGRLVGYAYASLYRTRSAYRFTLEDSIYVDAEFPRHGIGRLLLAALIARAEAGPWRQMIAVIGDSANAGSIGVHRALGFTMTGTLAAVGFKHGRWVDSVLMQRPLGAGASTLPEA